MKQRIIAYKKCLCCGNTQGSFLRDKNVNNNITDSDVYYIIASSCEENNRIRTDWCDVCNMVTKQEVVAWDYTEGKKATPPNSISNSNE